jgi:hypothetical protein
MCRGTIGEDIMCGLKIERLLDFGIRGYQEMDENKRRYKEREKEICSRVLVLSFISFR